MLHRKCFKTHLDVTALIIMETERMEYEAIAAWNRKWVENE